MVFTIKPHKINGNQENSSRSITNNCEKRNSTPVLPEPECFEFPENYPYHLQEEFFKKKNKKKQNPPFSPVPLVLPKPLIPIPVCPPKPPVIPTINDEPDNYIIIKLPQWEEKMEIIDFPLFFPFEERTTFDNQSSMELSVVIPKRKEEYILDIKDIPSGKAGDQTVVFSICVNEDDAEIYGNYEGGNTVYATKREIL